jgi:NAD(P)-dependent dehydrogenase (short-subunit alcohol dehydrogenase family)
VHGLIKINYKGGLNVELGLEGKAAIITGGASNIGRGIVLGFAKEKVNIVLADIDEDQAKKVAEEANALGGSTTVIKTDVTNWDSVQAMVKQTLEEFGKIDILVNVVGWDKIQPFLETTPDFWDKVINLNYRGDLNCFKAVLPHMVERKYGKIVSIASDAGRIGEFREAVYSGCKAGVIALSKAIAREVGRYGININVVCPGVVVPESKEVTGTGTMWTEDMMKIFTPEAQEKAAKNYVLRRLGKAGDIADAVLFLASDRASYITGQTLSVSGGYTMM